MSRTSVRRFLDVKSFPNPERAISSFPRSGPYFPEISRYLFYSEVFGD